MSKKSTKSTATATLNNEVVSNTKSVKSAKPTAEKTKKSVKSEVIYESYRIETYKSGEGKKRYTYDGRTAEGLSKATEFANKKWLEGCKVVLYKLDRVKKSDGSLEWVRTDIKEADNRVIKSKKSSPKKTAEKPSAKQRSEKPTAEKTAEKCQLDNSLDRLDRLEAKVDELAKAMELIAKALTK